jgi:hypothetical protein
MVRKSVAGFVVSALILYMGSASAATKPCGEYYGQSLSRVSVLKPEVGIESESELGEGMISSRQGSEMVASITLSSDVHFHGKYFGSSYEVVFPAGSLTTISTPNGAGFTSDQATFKYDGDRKPRSGFGKPDMAVFVDPKNPSTLIGWIGFGLTSKTIAVDDAGFVMERCLLGGTKGFRQELIYSGISKGTVSLQYREFSDDMARPAFSQDLHYDLADGDEIGFKGARIKIIKATNVSVKFRVIKPLE